MKWLLGMATGDTNTGTERQTAKTGHRLRRGHPVYPPRGRALVLYSNLRSAARGIAPVACETRATLGELSLGVLRNIWCAKRTERLIAS